MPARQKVQVIPVLDLLGGVVVRALRGERSAYKPIVSPLVQGSEPLAVASVLLDRCTAPGRDGVLYVADLDALQGRKLNADALARLLGALPRVTLWLDAGFADADVARAVCRVVDAPASRLQPVFGSESLRSAQALAELRHVENAILSLDSKHARAVDPSGSWQRPDLWPATMIVMTLDRVGAARGPDLDMFEHLRQQAPDRRWVGAGGIRGAADLSLARRAGADAWLVASALHDGQLDPRGPA
jgi:phosphoribosylformimino-5-aminoimidazole carboxamide ribotide isomerase